MLENLFANPMLEEIVNKRVKKLMEKHNIKFIGISVNDKNEIEYSIYNEKVSVIKKEDFDKIINSINKKTIENEQNKNG